MKKTYYKVIDYLTDYNPGNSNVKVELDLKNYATKEEIKNITHIGTNRFALKTNLALLKTEINKLDVPNLITTPTDLDKLTKEVQKDFTKRTDFNSLKTKVDKNETDNENLGSIVNKNDTAIKTC